MKTPINPKTEMIAFQRKEKGVSRKSKRIESEKPMATIPRRRSRNTILPTLFKDFS